MTELRVDPSLLARTALSPSTARSIRVALPGPDRPVPIPDIARLEERVGEAARGGTFTKVNGCVDGVHVYGVPCSLESLQRYVLLEDVWNETGNVLRALLEHVPQFPLTGPASIEAAANWCLTVCRTISLRLQATGINPRFMVKPSSPWIAQSKPADPRVTERVRCELPSSWSEWCWQGERKPDVKAVSAGDSVMWTLYFRSGPAQRGLAEAAGSTPYWATQVDARAKLSYVLPAADWWNASHEWQDYFTQNPLDLVWPLWKDRPLSALGEALVRGDALYPRGLLDARRRGDLNGMAPSDRLRALFAYYGTNPAGHFEISSDGRTYVPTSKGQVAFCEAMLRDFLSLEQRSLENFVFDSFSYYMLNHITWYAEAGLIGVAPGEIRNMVTAAKRAKQSAVAGGIGAATGALASSVFGPVAGQVVGRVASGFSRAIFGWIGKLVGAGGPGCPQTLMRRNLGGAMVGSESCTVQQLMERYRPPEAPPPSTESAGLHWGWKLGAGAAIGLVGILIIRRFVS